MDKKKTVEGGDRQLEKAAWLGGTTSQVATVGY